MMHMVHQWNQTNIFSHTSMCLRVRLFLFSRITLKRSGWHMAKQNKENGMGRNGRARRIVSPWSFFFFFSTFTPTLILPGAFCSGRIQQTNETACVSFSFSLVGNLLASMKRLFFWGCFSRERAQLQRLDYVFVHSQALGDWVEHVRLTICILSEDKGKRKYKACTGRQGKVRAKD